MNVGSMSVTFLGYKLDELWQVDPGKAGAADLNAREKVLVVSHDRDLQPLHIFIFCLKNGINIVLFQFFKLFNKNKSCLYKNNS